MANAAEAHLISFRWKVVNPFLPLRELKTSFFGGAPTVTQWEVTFTPAYRSINLLEFTLRLKLERIFNRRSEITADNTLITINLNDARIATKPVPNCRFVEAYWHTFSFQEVANIEPQTTPHRLVIDIHILLPGMIIGRGIGNGLIFNNDDLRRLSEDFRKLLVAQNYCNMILTTNDNPFPIGVHSYIMRARWDNFFERHHYDEAAQRPVELLIPRDLLWNLLVYMYSGEFESNWPNWRDPAYTSELFQVIDRYKLYHLYKVFVKNDLFQVRESRDNVLIDVRRFPIHFENAPQIQVRSEPWSISQPDYGYGMLFQMLARDESNGPWLSYSLLSTSASRIHAHVYLEVIKEVETNVFQRVCHLEDLESAIEPFQRVDSRRVLFLGSREIFGDHNLSSALYIRCYLTITSGIRVEKLQSADDRRQPVSERRLALSDAMYGLVRTHNDQDMTVYSNSEGGAEVVDLVHKGIFVSRVPEFWRGIEDHIEGEPLRDTATFRLSGDALPIVINYIYTGKVFPIPNHLLDEIEGYAEGTNFVHLRDLIRRIRNADRRNE